MFKSFSDAETGILFCTVSCYKPFCVCLPFTIFYPLLFLLAPQIQYQSKRPCPSVLVHDSAICFVSYISFMDLKGQKCSLWNIVRLIARDNIAYISSLELKLNTALRGIACSILCSLLKSINVLRYAALYVVHEKLFNRSETDPLHTAFRSTKRL